MTDKTKPDLSRAERYEPYTDEGNREGYGEMEKQPDGEWVRYEDYRALLDAKEAAEAHAELGWDQQRHWSERYQGALAELTEARASAAAAWEAGAQAVITAPVIVGPRSAAEHHAHMKPPADATEALRRVKEACWLEGFQAFGLPHRPNPYAAKEAAHD